MNLEEILKSLTNQPCTEDQANRIETLRESYKNVAVALFGVCRPSANTTLAIRCLEDSLMRAVKSIVLE